MVCNVYAFLVGIDSYPPPLPPLKGCINDVEAFEQYLRGCIQDTPDYALPPPHRLTNEQATRQAVIDGFQTYLTQAQSGDVALFYYSGHGSQAPSPPEFWQIEPDRFNETLVCWDSRLEGQWDLADKELASLIAEVDKRTPHILVILDCCHSGAGTRSALPSMATRQVPADIRQRPLETFVSLPQGGSPAIASRSAQQPVAQNLFPKGRHVLLAACREHEEARELLGGDNYRGAFSYFLLETLQQASGPLSYRDLFRRANARVRSQMAAQSPQLEATHPSDLDQPFLGGASARSRPYYTVFYDQTAGWSMDGGAVHGIPPLRAGAAACPRLALFPFNTASATLQDAKQAIAHADIIEVLPQLSHLRIVQGDEHLADSQAVFKAVMTAVPLPAITVSLAGEETGIQWVRQALETASPNGQPSPYLQATTETAAAHLQVLAEAGTYLIRRPADASLLVNPIHGYSSDHAAIAVRQLEHMARWLTVADLTSPAASQIPADALQIQIYQGTQSDPLRQSQIQLAYEWDANQNRWQQPTFRIKLSNQCPLTLFCALYDLTETFQIISLLEGGTVRLDPQEEVWVAQGNPIYGSVPKALWQQGVTEFNDTLKAIACTADFDATLLEQDELGHPITRAIEPRSLGRSALNRLMQRVMVRNLGMTPETDETHYDDWITNQVTFTVVRPQPTTAISPDQAVDLGYGVTLHPHPSLQGSVRLATLSQGTRNLKHPALPPLLRAEPQITSPLPLVKTRSLESDLHVLELENITQAATVTSEHPLTLFAPISLDANESVLPLAFDGEFFIPLGRGRTRGNQTEILLERLPDSSHTGTRNLGGSVRIFFQKVVAQKLGLEFPYPILAMVEGVDGEPPRYNADRAAVMQRVSSAQKILLCIHGIFGNTQSMVVGAHQTQIEVDGQSNSLLDVYDLVLTFDYENLNTPIGDLAQQLGDRLTAVGLSPGHSKTLHIVAHSLGGLVARYFIERHAGNRVVQHLIMLGTPNAGSPWSTLQDWATAALTIGLNSLSSVALPVKALGSLMAAIELVDVTLDQMKPGSDFLRSLADSADPGVPYTVLAGNSSLISLPDAASRHRVMQLLDRLGRAAVEFPFMSQPNDLAATVYSMQALPSQRSPSPQSLEVACHHLSYFTEAAGRQALGQAILEASRFKDKPDAAAVSQPPPTPAPQSLSDTPPHPPSKFWLLGLLLLTLTGVILGIWLFQRQSEESESSTSAIVGCRVCAANS
ncbi:MAG: caspase family protein [Leptolyngbya sp. SIO1E4]|nr:caspase family protein [Leptolyngbya sp. SIO1E4]